MAIYISSVLVYIFYSHCLEFWILVHFLMIQTTLIHIALKFDSLLVMYMRRWKVITVSWAEWYIIAVHKVFSLFKVSIESECFTCH